MARCHRYLRIRRHHRRRRPARRSPPAAVESLDDAHLARACVQRPCIHGCSDNPWLALSVMSGARCGAWFQITGKKKAPQRLFRGTIHCASGDARRFVEIANDAIEACRRLEIRRGSRHRCPERMTWTSRGCELPEARAGQLWLLLARKLSAAAMRPSVGIAERMREIVGHRAARHRRCRCTPLVFAGENPSV